MRNFDIELGVIFGIYSGLRLSFRVRKHFKIYCPKDSKSSSLVGVMIIVNVPLLIHQNVLNSFLVEEVFCVHYMLYIVL